MVVHVGFESEDELKALDESFDIPFVGLEVARGVLIQGIEDDLFHHFVDECGDIAVFQYVLTHFVDDQSLPVHHVVVFDDLFSDFEVVLLDLTLCALDGARDHFLV